MKPPFSWSLASAPDGASTQDVINGTAYDDTLNGTIGDDTISGAGGDDVVSGGSGSDSLSGGAGDDSITGGSGGDTIVGGPGQDTLIGGSGDDLIIVQGLTKSLVDGGSGLDTVSLAALKHGVQVQLGGSLGAAYHSIEGLIGTDFADQLSASGVARQILDGGAGSDTLAGGAHTTLLGGDGDDVIFSQVSGSAPISGGDGADAIFAGAGFTIDAGAGDDAVTTWINRGATVTGGDGADTFTIGQLHHALGPIAPEIVDLSNEDKIDLSAIDADVTQKYDQAFTLVSALDGHAGEAALSYDSGADQTTLMLDTNGDGAADWAILLDGDHTDFTNFVL